MKSFPMQKIMELHNDGKIFRQVHPYLPLQLFKYTIVTQYKKDWDEITIRCRGLILDNDGVLVSNPIPKFFNDGEYSPGEIPRHLPFRVFEKLDGTFIQVVRYNEHLIVTSVGSFESPHSKLAEYILHTKHKDAISNIEHGKTYCFELIVPNNRIVVNYGNINDLLLLLVRDNDTDEETYPDNIGFQLVQEYTGKDLDSLLLEKENTEFINREGYVVVFSNGFRMKIKFNPYCELHRILTGINEYRIWEALRDNIPLPLAMVPDEFFQFVTETQNKLISEFQEIEAKAKEIFKAIYSENRKQFALKALETPYQRILFNMFEGKEYGHNIWKMIEPDKEKSKFQSLKFTNA